MTVKKSFLILVAAISLVAVSFTACNSSNSAIETMSAENFESKLQQTTAPQLIDVRTPDEFNEFHIAGALNIDVNGAGFEEAITALNRAKPLFVYCRGGVRSMKAAEIMEREGFKTIYNLAGGITEWIEKGRPTE